MSIQDDALAESVSAALAQDKRLSGLPIVVRAASGEIHLKGKVDTEEQKELATMVVHGVQGVRNLVNDELVVREGGE